MSKRPFLLGAAFVACTALPASAHSTLETPQTTPGSYKAVMRVPHGCDGQATHTVAIDIPEGFINAKPMPKAGWDLATDESDYERAYAYHGRQLEAGVTRITWSGGRLEDGHYDEFVFVGTVDPSLGGKTVAFPTSQICDGGELHWHEVAADGQDPHELNHPAPTLTVAEGAENEHAGHGHGHAESGATATTDGQSAHTISAGDLELSAYWARATLPNQPVGGGYVTIENTGDTDDRLVSVTADVTPRTEIHEMSMENDVMQMRPLPDGLAIPAGETVSLEPGGYHLMFMDLTEGFDVGETVSVTLTFENAGEIALDLPVRARDGATGGHKH